MTPERWQQVKAVLDAALEHDRHERAAFISKACDGDEHLRKELESLIISYEQAGSFIEEPAVESLAEIIADKGESLINRELGSYQVEALLGTGGMGEVYLAKDTRLDRRIALKVLPAHLSDDKDRLRRFQQEARAASSLNHPNILTIYEVGEDNDRPLIATEFIEGQTLREHMTEGPLELSEALDISRQVASALSAAHEAGIVHRDIKPENIMIRRDGFVKVLDFGLVKLTEKRATGSEASTLVNTAAGVVMGTSHYMSPEQARGEEVDVRTDLWSLGVVLYEMVAGCAPFDKPTPNEVIALILEREPPPLSRHGRAVPIDLEQIISKALTKNREERYQTATDLLVDLRRLQQRLELDAEIHRSRSPESGHAGAVVTDKQIRARQTSSAEYIVNQIKTYKRGLEIVLAALLVVVVTAFYFYFSRSSRSTINSIAVLPFVNVGADPNTEYLSDGVTESLINSLSRLPKLRMIARSTVFRYKGRETDPQTVGRELGVEAILTGRVAQHGEDLLISAELVDVNNNSRLWGEQYSRKLSDLLTVQSEISQQISQRLELRPEGENQKRLAKHYTDNTEAYQLYLKGRYFLLRNDEASIQRAREYFQQAIQKDPSYGLAYSGLADTYLDQPGETNAAATKAAVMKALEIDSSLAEAHISLASILWHREWDFARAEQEFKRGLELNSSNEDAHHDYSHYLMALNRTEESLAESKRYLELDPLSPPGNVHMGWYYLITHQYDQAIEWERRALAMDTNFRNARFQLAEAYYYKGMFDEAVEEYLKAGVLSAATPEMIESLRAAYKTLGISGFLQKWLADEKQSDKRLIPYIPKAQLAAKLYARLGAQEKAMESLEKAVEDHDLFPDAIRAEPEFGNLRTDPRFTDLLRRIGLPQN
jgi:eukaryotic-like serine/threonine-protein kinase